MVIPTDLRAAREIQQQILGEVKACGYTEESIFAIKLAMEEAVTNAIKHGNRYDRAKKVTVNYAISPQRTEIVVADEGGGFTPYVLPDPTVQGNLECPSGRGVMLMRAYMDEVQFSDRGTCVRMVKYNS